MAADATCLRSPLLRAWAGAVAWAASFLCHLLEWEADCSRPPPDGCGDTAWLQLSLAFALLVAAASVAALLWHAALRWSAGDGARAVAVAAEVLTELRRAAPAQYPSQRHMFASLPANSAPSDPLAPLFCAVCHGGVGGGSGGGLAATLQCCSACGLVAHDSCARRAGKTCTPLCCSAPRLPHFWQARGTALEEDAAAGGLSCLYCGEPAETDGLVAAEPLWRCSLCAGACHVQCFCEAHPHLPTVAGKLQALLERQGGGAAAKPVPAHQGGAVGGSSPSSSSPSSDGKPALQQLTPASPGPNAAPKGTGLRRRQGGPAGAAGPAAASGAAPRPLQHPRSSSWLQSLAGWRRSPCGAGAGAGRAADSAADTSGYSSDSEAEDVYDARLQRQRLHRRRRRRIQSADLDRLDECGLGPNRRSVLPPTAVRPALRSAGSSQARLDAAADGGAAEGGAGGAVPSPFSSQQQQGQAQRRGGDDASREAGGGREPGSGSKRKSSWWRRLYRPKRMQWEDYRIDELPRGCKPLLVFLNTKSGPQVGAALRRRFLRALHPLQVVELPRQQPGPALRLFSGVASHLRILVVGGDGSVAWVLSCLEELKAEEAARGDAHWKPPPVGVLPLGTGNDLARCLGWGGGNGKWAQEGIGTMLAEVQHAAPLHIDRWDVALAPPPRLDEPPATPRGKLASMLQRGGSYALGSLGSGGPRHDGGGGGGGAAGGGGGPVPVLKQMNNYLGVGVDAKVALDFHRMREQLPFFFTSQLGNKLWYTTIGGVDIVQGHACSDIARKLQVLCDGRPVVLPPDIEGLLVLNINSYMGGVDLWRNSYTLPGVGVVGDRGGGRHPAQSMMDGKLELVAVYGSWHLGQLQVGLSRAVRLGQGCEVLISSFKPLPMQVDGEPWVQAPAALRITRRNQGLVLRRVHSKPLGRMMQALAEVLEDSEHRGTISSEQHRALMGDLSARLTPLLLHPA